MSLMIPEITLKSIIDGLLLYVKNDYEDAVDKSTTIIYRLLYGKVIDKYNLYTQAVKIFTAPVTDPRKLEANWFFNTERAHIPTIHITLPNEEASGDGIGIDQNYVEPYYQGSNYIEPFTRGFNTTFNIVITSDNTFEVITIYHILRSLMISAFTTLEINGLRNVKLGGGDLALNPDITPQNIFARNITLSIFYETEAVPFTSIQAFTNLIFQGTAIPEDYEESDSSN